MKDYMEEASVPMEVVDGDLMSAPVTRREMLWSEAVHYVRTGIPAYLPHRFHAEQDRINEGLLHCDEVAEDATKQAELRGPVGYRTS